VLFKVDQAQDLKDRFYFDKPNFPAYGEKVQTISVKDPAAFYGSELIETVTLKDGSIVECFSIGENKIKYLFLHKSNDRSKVYANLRFMDIESDEDYELLKTSLMETLLELRSVLKESSIVCYNTWTSGAADNIIIPHSNSLDFKGFENCFSTFLREINTKIYNIQEAKEDQMYTYPCKVSLGPIEKLPAYENGEYPLMLCKV
jgi:hypothetical protein